MSFAGEQNLFSFSSSQSSFKTHSIETNGAEFGRLGLLFSLDQAAFSALKMGEVVSLALPEGQSISATVVKKAAPAAGRNKAAQESRTVLAINSGRGSIEFAQQGESVKSLKINHLGTNNLDRQFQTYKIILDASGAGEVFKQDPNAQYCLNYPKDLSQYSVRANAQAAPLFSGGNSPTAMAITPSEADLKNLQSKPNANHVVYLDFWGGTLSDTKWNDEFNSGNPIVYTPYSFDAILPAFSAIDLDRIWLAFREVREDYAMFDVNITTDQSIYDASPVEKRSMVIATTTDVGGLSSGGGIAYADGFGNGYEDVAWVWNASADTLGVTLSHEVGHQTGLSHDGTFSQEYYPGHGFDDDWGAIMGAPFGQAYTQWSKGEYTNANNTEDDLLIIKDVLGEQVDAIGGTLATALDVSAAATFQGVIEPLGLNNTIDTDVFTFSIPSTQAVTVDVAPLLGAESEALGTNLSLTATLKDSANTTLAVSTPTTLANPQTNILQYSNAALSAGTYSLSVEAESYETSWALAFGEYANAGLYQIEISSDVTEPDLIASMTAPALELTADSNNDFRAKISNIANTSAAASNVRFYESSDGTITPADTLLASVSTTTLAAGEAAFVQANLSAPLTAGTIWLGVCVDAVAGETVISNNCSAGTEITVLPKDDEDDGLCFPVKTQAGKVALICL